MAKQKKPRNKTYNAKKHAVRAPKLLNRLPIPAAGLQNLRRAHLEKVMRLYFKTESVTDVINLFTFFCISSQLAVHMESEEALKESFDSGKALLERAVKESGLERSAVDALSDIVDLGISVWAKSSTEEILLAEKLLRDDKELLDIERLFGKATESKTSVDGSIDRPPDAGATPRSDLEK